MTESAEAVADGAREAPAAPEVAGRSPRRRIPFPVLALTLAVLAALVRLPYLQQIPRFTDEWDDTETALAIAREAGFWPLISNDHYNGPVFHYLLAAGFRLGQGLTWPRLLALRRGRRGGHGRPGAQPGAPCQGCSAGAGRG
jgi:hypothetical protein